MPCPRWTFPAIALIACLAALPVGGFASQDSTSTQPPATRPATRPADDVAELARQLVDLNDGDPAVREAARRRILSLRVDELPGLLEAVRLLPESARASSTVAVTLYDAAMHIHLRDARKLLLAQRRSEIGMGDAFLGVSLGGDPWNRTDNGRSGVAIRATEPGFVAYEVFEEGDLLVGVRGRDGLDRLVNYADLRSAFQRLAPGDSVEFLVMRGGRVLRIPVVLDERMATIPGIDEQWNRVEATARRQADAFWHEHLAPLLSRDDRTTAQAR